MNAPCSIRFFERTILMARTQVTGAQIGNESLTNADILSGTEGYVLTSAASGNAVWAAPAVGATNSISQGNSDVTVTDAGTGSVAINVDGSPRLSISSNYATNSVAIRATDGNNVTPGYGFTSASSMGIYSGSGNLYFAAGSGNAALTLTGLNASIAGTLSNAKKITLGYDSGSGGITFSDSAFGTTTIKSPATAGDITLTLPTTAGTASQVLTTNGSGVLSWSTVSAVTDIVFSPSPATSPLSSGITISAVAGETVAAGDVCYMKSDGKYWKCDATNNTKGPASVLATAAITAEATGVFLVQGYWRNDAENWTVGGLIYATTTAGDMSHTKPSATGNVVQILGYARHADVMYFNPNYMLVEIA
jgi:hypothetical protein